MGFAAEMKDFNTAVAQGQKMVGAVDDRAYNQTKKDYLEAQTETLNQKNNDKEGQAADLALKKANANRANAGASSEQEWARASKENSAVAAQQRQSRIDADKAVAASQAGAVAAGAPQKPAPVAVQQAVPAVPAASPPVNADGFPVAPEPAPVNLAMSGGGSVQKLAGGGAVAADDEEDDEEDDPEPAAAPAAVPAENDGTSDATDISSRSRGFSGQAGLDAVKAGMTYGSKALGLHVPGNAVGGDSPGRGRAAKAWASGAHAAPAEDMDKLRKQVDPEGKLGESEANLAALGAVYQFKMGRGDVEGAGRAAFQMLQYHRQASQRYAVIAAHAAENGDLDTATHAAMKAYANVPDGKDVKFQKTPDGKISYTYTDNKTGQVMSQGVEDPDKLASAAMGFAAKGFDSSLMAAIKGTPADREKPAVDPNSLPMKSADKKAAIKGVDDAYKAANPAAADDQAGDATAARSPEEERTLKGAALRIGAHTANPRITHDEALAVATKVARPDLGKSTMKSDPAPGGYRVSVDGRKPVFVPADDMADLVLARKANEAKQKAAQDEAAKPNFASRTATAAKDATKKYTDYLTKGEPADTPAQRAKEKATRKTFTDPQVP